MEETLVLHRRSPHTDTHNDGIDRSVDLNNFVCNMGNSTMGI